MEPALPDTTRKDDLPTFFRALGLPSFAAKAQEAEDEKRRLAAMAPHNPLARKFVQAAASATQPKPTPPPEPRWRFLSIPEEAITHRIRGSARIALPGEPEGFGIWIPRFRLKSHGDGIVLAARVDIRYVAEKREKAGGKWKTVASRTLSRADLAKLFPPAAATWDDLTEYDAPDNPKWSGHAWVKHREPPPLGAEEREIRNELLIGSEEASWQEADA